MQIQWANAKGVQFDFESDRDNWTLLASPSRNAVVWLIMLLGNMRKEVGFKKCYRGVKLADLWQYFDGCSGVTDARRMQTFNGTTIYIWSLHG